MEAATVFLLCCDIYIRVKKQLELKRLDFDHRELIGSLWIAIAVMSCE